MKRHIDRYYVANEIRMKRTVHKGAFLIVEGDSDARMYRKFIDGERARVIISHNKENALYALEILEKDGFPGVMAVVDSDYWHIEGVKTPSRNVVTTDSHDIETMLLRSPALENVMSEYADEKKYHRYLKNVDGDLRNVLLEDGVYIGYLRLIALRKNLSIRFKGLRFDTFISPSNMRLDMRRFMAEISRNSENLEVRHREIEQAMGDLTDKKYDPWHVSNGHDLIEILVIGMRNVFGSYNSREMTPPALEGALRLAYEYRYFKETRVFRAIKNWEEHNIPYIVLEE